MTRHELLSTTSPPAGAGTGSGAGRAARPVPPVLCFRTDVPLTGRFAERLIAAEQAGAHLVLLASTPGDLVSPIAAIARLVVTDDESTVAEATARYGAERVIRADPEVVDDWITQLPTPESMTTRRRIRRALRQLPGAASLHAKITRRPR